VSAYLNTRVSLFASRLWQLENFQALLHVPEAEIPQALVDGGLVQLSGVVPGNDIHSLEKSIIAQLLEETLILLRPLTGASRALLLYWTERFEVTNLKTLLRGKMTGERPAALLNRLTPMGAFGHLDVQDLSHAEDVAELLRRLELGHYSGIVRQAREAFEDSHDPFLLDAALDRSYYEGLAHRAQELEQNNGPALRQLMGPLIDRINLVWMLRYRFNYKLPPAQVYYLLVASHYGLSSARLKELAALGNLDDVLAALPEGLRLSLAGSASIPEVFARMERAASEQALKVLRSSAPDVVRAFAYLILRERDLRAVRAILRGRHLGLSNAMIQQTVGQLAEEAL
jgi:V/A-type H+/Na+-transporting ATPase subunit C